MKFINSIDRFLLRFLVGTSMCLIGVLLLRNSNGFWNAPFFLVMLVGLVAAVSGLPWIGVDKSCESADGSLESQYPVGHVLAASFMALIGLCMIWLAAIADDSLIARAALGIIGILVCSVGLIAAIHCATFRVRLCNGAIQSTGGVFANKRLGPYRLDQLSKRKGVDLLPRNPRTYRLNFVRKRHLDLPSHMNGTHAILIHTNQFYLNDFAWDRHPKED